MVTEEKKDNTTFSCTLEMIPVDKLEINPENPYRAENMQIGVNDLIESFQIVGLLTPLTVKGPNEQGTYYVLAGNRRITAIKQMGDAFWDTRRADKDNKCVPCYVCDNNSMNADEEFLSMEHVNIIVRDQQTINIHRTSVVQRLIKMEQSGDLKSRELSKKASEILHLSDRWARVFIQVGKRAEDRIKSFYNDRWITLKQAGKISEQSPETQLVIADKIQALIEAYPEKGKKYSDSLEDILSEYLVEKNDKPEGRIEHLAAHEITDYKASQDDDSNGAKTLIKDPDDYEGKDNEGLFSNPDEESMGVLDNDYISGGGYGYEQSLDEDFYAGSGMEFQDIFDVTDKIPDIPEKFDDFLDDHPVEVKGTRKSETEPKQKEYDIILRDQKAKQVIAWCNQILNCVNPTDAELSAIDACKKVSVKYSV